MKFLYRFFFSNRLYLAGLFFIFGVIVSGLTAFLLGRQILIAASDELIYCKSQLVQNVQVNPVETKWKDKLSYIKDYGKLKLGMFDSSGLLGRSFIVAPVENGLPVTTDGAYVVFPFYANGEDFKTLLLFEVFGDNIYVVDQTTGLINIYKLFYSGGSQYLPPFYQWTYQGNIERTKGIVGSVDSIKCQDNLCHLTTVANPSSGCDLELNLSTKKYSNIRCSSMSLTE